MHAIEDNFTHMGYVAGKSREESEKLAAKYKNIKTRAEMLEALEDGYNYGDMVLSEMNDQNARGARYRDARPEDHARRRGTPGL